MSEQSQFGPRTLISKDPIAAELGWGNSSPKSLVQTSLQDKQVGDLLREGGERALQAPSLGKHLGGKPVGSVCQAIAGTSSLPEAGPCMEERAI